MRLTPQVKDSHDMNSQHVHYTKRLINHEKLSKHTRFDHKFKYRTGSQAVSLFCNFALK